MSGQAYPAPRKRNGVLLARRSPKAANHQGPSSYSSVSSRASDFVRRCTRIRLSLVVRRRTTVVRESVNLLELLRKQAAGGDLDFLREAVAVLAEAVMEAEVAAQVGAGYGERSETRLTRRNGYRRWDTRAGSIELQIPKLRRGSYFPALLEPRRRAERALLAVVQQAYVEGVSTRRVDDLVRSLGCEGISKSQVSRICSELDTVVASFLERPLDGGP